MLEEPKVNWNFEIKKGHIERYMGRDNEPKVYKKIGGVLTGIRAVDKDINGHKMRYLYFYLNDVEAGVTYAIQTTLYKGAGPNIVRSLAYALENNVDITGEELVIDVYSKERNGINYTNANLTIGGQRLEWVAIPQGTDINSAIEKMVEEIASAVKGPAVYQHAAEQADEEAPYDEGPDDLPPGEVNPFANYARK